MKKLITLFSLIVSLQTSLWAGFVDRMPVSRVQPNGDTIHFFVTGDEYYHRYHDAQEYTLVLNTRTGYWVYADTVHNDRGGWALVPTELMPGVDNPSLSGLTSYLTIDKEEWSAKQKFYDIPTGLDPHSPKTGNTNHGTINNVVIFIRFSDESEITTSFSDIDAMFNDSSANATSMYNYFRHASYKQISIPTYFYPEPSGDNVISYQDIYSRSYYMPYDAMTNTNGYQDDSERATREFDLIERAVNYVQLNSNIPTTLNLDYDNDGLVDNICFVVKGTYTGWSDLLWPHKWALYDRTVYLNSKRVYTFNLQLEGSGSHYFSSSTFSHEMFHTLGAPDLYRYDVGDEVSGVGSWDLMCNNTTPPQHMSAYMKYKYGNWIESIPEITLPGTYTLHSLADTGNVNNCYRIASQDPYQWYILEYRDYTEDFEVALPGKGLLIYRIDTRFNGNASFDGVDYFDEVYLFRPGGIDDMTNGNTATAYFSGSTSRTNFSPSTNPFPWLTNNILDTTFAIYDVTVPGETISFTYSDLRGCRIPDGLAASNVTGTSAVLRWSGNATTYRLRYHEENGQQTFDTLVNGTSVQISNLTLGTRYQWQVRALCSDSDSSGFSSMATFVTNACLNFQIDTIGHHDDGYYFVPFNVYYNYSYTQQIYTADELNGPLSINKIAFNNVSDEPITCKEDVNIYLGHTNAYRFIGTGSTSIIPFSDLTLVYQGPMNCVPGWNEFSFSEPFNYNGISNLVVAIDDNSGYYENRNFAATNTTEYTTLTYYADYYNFNPATDDPADFDGTKTRKRYRADIQFFGCPTESTALVTLLSADPSMGTVSQGGEYPVGETVTATATPHPHYHFLYWISDNGDTIAENPLSFQIDHSTTLTAHFAIDQHHIQISVTNPDKGDAWITNNDSSDHIRVKEGDFDYGTTLWLEAIPSESTFGIVWSTDDHLNESLRPLTLTQDTSVSATFICPDGIDGSSSDNIKVTTGKLSITVEGTEGRLIRLFDIEGRELDSRVNSDMVRFAVPTAGVYLLKADGLKVIKVVIL